MSPIKESDKKTPDPHTATPGVKPDTAPSIIASEEKTPDPHSAKSGDKPDTAPPTNAQLGVKPKPGNPTLLSTPITVTGLYKADAAKAAKKARQVQNKSDKKKGSRAAKRRKNMYTQQNLKWTQYLGLTLVISQVYP